MLVPKIDPEPIRQAPSADRLTPKEKTEAETDKATLPPPTIVDGEYLQIFPLASRAGVTIERHQYVGSAGIGYEEWIKRTKGTTTWGYYTHTGPEKQRDALSGQWMDITTDYDGP